MQLLGTRQGGAMLVRLIGELDHHSAVKTREELDAYLRDESVRNLTLDLSGLTFMDSSGIGVIIGRYKLINGRGGTLTIQKPGPSVDKLLRMSGVYGIVRKVGS